MDRPLALRAYVFLGAIEATAAMTAFFVVLYTAGWIYGTAFRLTTRSIDRRRPRA